MAQDWDLLMWIAVAIFVLAAAVALFLLWSAYKEKSRDDRRSDGPDIGSGVAVGDWSGGDCGGGDGGGAGN
jgi:heme/copper-type cytochrome/quinol oxidase subunit 2